MRSAQQWFDAYGASHKNPTNKAIHWVCVPAILFVTIGLLWSIPTPFFRGVLPGAADPWLNFGTLGILVALAFYLRMSVTIFLGMLVVSVGVAAGNFALDRADLAPLWAISGIVFAIAWVGQFIGHKIEGKKPSFMEDLAFLLVGPAWLLHYVYRRLGIPY